MLCDRDSQRDPRKDCETAGGFGACAGTAAGVKCAEVFLGWGFLKEIDQPARKPSGYLSAAWAGKSPCTLQETLL